VRLYIYRELTWRQGAWLFGGVGVITVSVAVYVAWLLNVELRTWPRVDARVDSADVITVSGVNGTSYASRVWLFYEFNGVDHQGPATVRRRWADYASAAGDALEARRLGHLTALLDPRHPETADPRVGSIAELFLVPIIIGFLGLVFAAFAYGAVIMGRRQGFDQVGREITARPRFALLMFGGMGLLFVVAAVLAAILGPQSKSWIPVIAQVDSVDVVQVTTSTHGRGGRSTAYALRTWLTYSVNGRTYLSPTTANTARSDSGAAARQGRDARRGPTDILVDPTNPYRVVAAASARRDGVLIPLIFGLIGALLIAIGILIRRQATKPHRRAPLRKTAPATLSRGHR
jgi:hypothetical protein